MANNTPCETTDHLFKRFPHDPVGQKDSSPLSKHLLISIKLFQGNYRKAQITEHT